jgi:hypothetical protein
LQSGDVVQASHYRPCATRFGPNPRESSVRILRARIGSVLETERYDLRLLGTRALRAARVRHDVGGVVRCLP